MFLDKILATKREEVEAARFVVPFDDIVLAAEDAPTARGFSNSLLHPNNAIALIAEVKKASPSAGIIREDFHPVEIAREYERAGADCLSILTDSQYFQGSLANLHNIRREVDIPCLRKDFIIDEYQIYEARAAGADAVLLIVAALELQQLSDFHALTQELGMTALVEVHTDTELATALEINAEVIGINARDLKSFVTDIAVIERLAAEVPKNVILVGESGIKTAGDVQRLANAGVHAILVGETLMRSPDIGRAVKELMGS